ncbi:MAG: helix-turn-helix domain-containing protein [Chthoniobacteraceae bacterium]
MDKTFPHDALMSSFSTALTKTLETLKWTQKQLADETGINRPQINRYAKGTGGIELSGVAEILKAVPENHRAALLVAWLKDQTPTDFSQFVEIYPVENAVKEESPEELEFPHEADEELKRLIRWVLQRSIHNKEFRDMLEHLHKLIDGN